MSPRSNEVRFSIETRVYSIIRDVSLPIENRIKLPEIFDHLDREDFIMTPFATTDIYI
jgi:hypothetical protein